MTAMKTASISLALVLAFACGDTKTAKPTHSSPANAAGANATPQNLLDFDPNKMTDSELQSFVGQLSSRDAAETRELGLLQAMNQDLCDRLQRLRTECSATVRLLADGSEKVLGCQGKFADNTSVANKIQVKLAAAGSFVLLGNKTYGTKPFGAGDNVVQFSSTGDASARPPRFLDLSSLRIASADGVAMPALTGMGFELVVNESTVFTNQDLVSAEDPASKYYRINPANILALQKLPACTVEIAEIQDIRDKVMAALGAQAQPAAAAPAAQTTAQPAASSPIPVK